MESCRKCGKPTENTVTPVVYGLKGNTFNVCKDCMDSMLERFAKHRAEFERLKRGGMSNEDANQRMIDIIEGRAKLPDFAS